MSDSIGSKLRSLRKAKGYSQRYVAERVHMKRSTISNYEIGRRLPSLTDLKRIADYFGVSLDYFDLTPTDSVEELLAWAGLPMAKNDMTATNKSSFFILIECVMVTQEIHKLLCFYMYIPPKLGL